MKKKMIMAVDAVIIVASAVSALLLVPGSSLRRIFMGSPPRGNFTLNESSMDEVSAVFENDGTQEDVTGYCADHRFECMYYCRNVNPGHEMCSEVDYQRNPGGVPL
jgi:hypothetical protein